MVRVLNNLFYSPKQDKYFFKVSGKRKFQHVHFEYAREYCEKWGYRGYDILDRKYMDK